MKGKVVWGVFLLMLVALFHPDLSGALSDSNNTCATASVAPLDEYIVGSLNKADDPNGSVLLIVEN